MTSPTFVQNVSRGHILMLKGSLSNGSWIQNTDKSSVSLLNAVGWEVLPKPPLTQTHWTARCWVGVIPLTIASPTYLKDFTLMTKLLSCWRDHFTSLNYGPPLSLRLNIVSAVWWRPSTALFPKGNVFIIRIYLIQAYIDKCNNSCNNSTLFSVDD